nr:hypothetical protein Iba_chr03eCG8780 [Ipomoea batatas]
MAENGSRLYEVEMEMLKENMPYKILVPAMSVLVFAVGYIVGGDPVSHVPVMIKQTGFLAVIFSFLCCIASMCVYMVVRFQLKPPTPRKLFSLWALISATAALTFVIWMYAVLTYSSYTRLWISVTVVGLVCFPIFAYLVYAVALELALRIAIAEVIASGIASAIDSAIAGLINQAISHPTTQQANADDNTDNGVTFREGQEDGSIIGMDVFGRRDSHRTVKHFQHFSAHLRRQRQLLRRRGKRRRHKIVSSATSLINCAGKLSTFFTRNMSFPAFSSHSQNAISCNDSEGSRPSPTTSRAKSFRSML